MFREMRRKNQVLPENITNEVLERGSNGILSVIGDDGYPYGVPVSYAMLDGKIYFHCGAIGHRIDALKKNDKVSYCTYDNGYRKPNDWALNVKSVIVFGKITIVNDPERIIDVTTKLSHKFTNDEEYIQKEIKENIHRTLLLELTPEHVCGKLVNES